MRSATVMGMGITGRAVAEALLQRDIEVVALDDRISDDLLAWGRDHDVHVVAPADVDLPATLRQSQALLPAPGLPDHHPVFEAARQADVPIMSEFDLAAQWDDRPCVAVTGTDGKTTVVTLVERMLNESGVPAVSVGNTDTPYVAAIDETDTEVFVVEASSFRLGHSQHFAPAVGTWLNFGPDHLDAHADLASYESAKASIWKHLGAGSLAIGNRNDPVVVRHLREVRDAEVETFGLDQPPSDSDHGVSHGQLMVSGEPLVAINELTRSLPHDLENALAAAATALRVGANRDAAARVIRDFVGLEHRVELIGEIDGVRYINDSKATTPHAAAAALGGFERIVLLAGGKNKGLAFDDMLEHVDRIIHVVAIGDAASDIAAAFEGRVPITTATTMEEAIAQARSAATSGDVVLLSPACASYDWYRNYGERGHDFARIVREHMTNGESS